MVVNIETVRQIEAIEIDMMKSRLEAIKAMRDNPMGVTIRRFGHAYAFAVKHIPGPSFNTVKGLRAGDERFINELLEHYRDLNIPVQFELTPGQTSPELFSLLAQKGFYQKGFHTSLYAPLVIEDTLMNHLANLSIRPLEEEEFPIFADIYTQSFAMPDFLKNSVAQNNQILHELPSWSFYLASLGGVDVGIAVLFVKDGVANLAAAATLPEYRGKGIHAAFIRKRMVQALRQGCHLIVGQAASISISQNNMEKAGFNIAYHKAIWGS
ncbi:GNAT family N-acetyltransferase [Alkalihalobacillus pseudalcaliphilus]|uniref:GNAT family N-acetyltransferase n=1 Tax=Alkalihalobacillus pseudalcaliphilus TaxID=79884 RepID=UPI000A553C81|nr:GNAT family N-acetyltransferase [Alkalihalobacillus pseudalcaliphilus]